MRNFTRKQLNQIYTLAIREKFEFIEKYRGKKEASDVTLSYANSICEFLSYCDDMDIKDLKK